MKQLGSSKNNKDTTLTVPIRTVLASIPFILFLIGLTLLSIGYFRYVENESVLALFLEDRGNAISDSRNTTHWMESQPKQTEAEKDNIIPIVTQPSNEIVELPPEYVPEEPERLIVPFYYIGDKIGTLKIPSVSVEVGVFQGDREAEFRLGAGHYPGSYFPSQGNNILIAAHRTTYFKNLETLEVDDAIYFHTTYGLFEYVVTKILIIDGDDNSVAGETNKEQLTLYTCYPFNYFGNAPNRFVVIAELADD